MGSGVNDSCSLDVADIAVATSSANSDVAKIASDTVPTNDDLVNLLKTIEEVYRMFDDIQGLCPTFFRISAVFTYPHRWTCALFT